jgi:hypothetical protein
MATCFSAMMLISAFRHEIRFQHIPFMLIAVGGVGGGMFRSVRTFRQIRSMGIKWDDLETGSQLAQLLHLAEIDIKYIPFICNMMALAIMRLVHL